ncbi:hypothetical protein E1301_Tti022503 [Triplophysa tibetana]|uniref:C-type lectin domain-containing protein n=1 Tax=Triplophysa tibetana TaxID=1572043 RepID=A0A5A9PH36_9TELE|nr:hypothetical protein E1301_Tti022503 [Triplophysa tibetana]
MQNGISRTVICRHSSSATMLFVFIVCSDELILIQKNLSWTEAVRYCRENHVDLVSVDSQAIQLMVTEVLHEASTAEVWMGLRLSCSVGIWFWVNGEITCYQNWAPGNETAVDDCEREEELDEVASLWNTHRIRPVHNSRSPNGRPTIMHAVPYLYDARDYLHPVHPEEVHVCLEECVFKDYPCDKDVFDLCVHLIAEHNLDMSKDVFSTLDVYVKLRELINDELAEEA